MSDTYWELNLTRKLTKKFLSPNAVRDGMIESYCVLMKYFQGKKRTFISDADLNQQMFTLVREVFRENDLHYEIPPKALLLKVNDLIRDKIKASEIGREYPEALKAQETIFESLLSLMDESV